MSSEGNIFANPIIDPFIKRYNHNGRVTATLPIPDQYIPNGVDHTFAADGPDGQT